MLPGHSAPEEEKNASNIVGDDFPDSKRVYPDQKYTLNTTPIASTIPKGNDESKDDNKTWVFPSPQRFYNALKKKGWDPNEKEMHTVVSIHNTVNEMTWRKVLQYEEMHRSQCPNPKLYKFQGKPDELSLKARWRTLYGSTPPFDRHDWIVDRCGKKVRYIIDYYNGESEQNDKRPALFLDVRPEASLGGIWDRSKMLFRETFGMVPLAPTGTWGPPTPHPASSVPSGSSSQSHPSTPNNPKK